MHIHYTSVTLHHDSSQWVNIGHPGRTNYRCFHMGALMRIECTSDAHRMRIRSNPPPEVAFKQDRIIIHDSCKITPTTRSLAWLALLVGLAYSACLWLLFVLLLQQRWGRNRLVCWWPSRVVQHGKIKSTMVPLSTVQIWRTIAAQPAVLAGQVSEQPFSSSW